MLYTGSVLLLTPLYMENENLLPGSAEDLVEETGCPVDEIERMAEDMGFDFES